MDDVFDADAYKLGGKRQICRQYELMVSVRIYLSPKFTSMICRKNKEEIASWKK